MLIAIDPLYQEKLIRKGIDDKTLSALDDILKLCYRSRLFFKADLDFYDCLSQKYKKYLSMDTRRFLAFVIEKYSIIMSEIKEIDPLIIVDEKGDKELSSFASICTIDNLPSDYCPYIYCENVEDSNFYMNIFEALSNGKNRVYIKKDAYGGGNIATVEHRIKQGDILLCICDSDKKYADDSNGGTSDKMINAFLSNRHHYSYYYILNVREIENLIPYSFLQSTNVIKDAEVCKLIDVLNKCSEDTIDFFDVKSGYDKKTRKVHGHNIKWLNVNKRVIEAMKRNHMYHSSKGDTKLIKGFGENIIKQINDETFLKQYFDTMRTNRQTADVTNIMKEIKRFGFMYDFSFI